ncbi:MAG: restriction endonuclease subunit S [Candidatus Thiodiazotropha sp. (ex Dulcina madagascariensis)]|nr:restriction endonuclease subunit S [Candidatus Thiodiazotropha sp. (ex Dulcina madagascariensis)]
MSKFPLAKYMEIQKRGIDPGLFPNEQFYYYTIPDFDEGGICPTTLGAEIGSNKFLVDNGSLLISKLNPRIKRVWQVLNDEKLRSISSTEFVVVAPKEQTNIAYLYYILQSDEVYSRLESEAVGTTNSHVRFKPNSLLCIPAKFPRKRQQEKIAQILQTIDHTIEKTAALIEKYQQIKAGLMHDLFTRGIGADGKLRPPREQAPELYQQTPIGWIPKDWKLKPLEYGLSAPPKNGFSPKEVDSWQDVYVLGLGCLTRNGFRPIQLKNAPKNALFSGAKLEVGDFLISRSNTQDLVGLCGIYYDAGHDAIYPDLMIKLKFNQHIDGKFLEKYLLSKAVRQRISTIAVGTSGSMVKINATTLKALKIVYPEPDEQKSIVEKLQPIEGQIDSLEIQLNKLMKQKSGLMHDLLTGKVQVKPNEPEVLDGL